VPPEIVKQPLIYRTTTLQSTQAETNDGKGTMLLVSTLSLSTMMEAPPGARCCRELRQAAVTGQ